MNRKKALAITLFLFLAALLGGSASADLVPTEASAFQYHPYAMVYGENLDYNSGFWEGIDKTVCQSGGFCQSFSTSPGQAYWLIIDFAGQDPGVKNLDVTVAGTSSSYELNLVGNNPITYLFHTQGSIETLELAPRIVAEPPPEPPIVPEVSESPVVFEVPTAPVIPAVPEPPVILLLGSGLLGLAVYQGKARISRIRFTHNSE